MRQKKLKSIETDRTRRAQVEKMKQQAKKKDVDQVLQDFGLDLNSVPKNVEWIPLEVFDDLKFEDRHPQEWIEFFIDEKGEHIDFTARALVQDENEIVNWEPCAVQGYNALTNRWKVRFQDGDLKEVMRLHLLFDVEDPEKFGERLAKAYVDRIYMDSKIRYEFYINSMPATEAGELNHTSMNRILQKSKNTKKLRENAQLPIEAEKADVNKLYCRTMNKILFNKFLEEGGDKSSILPNKLILPDLQEAAPPEVQGLGMIELSRATETYEPKGESYRYPSSKAFSEIFQDFCLETVLTKRCTINALHEIRQMCLDVEKREIFKTKFSKEMKYEDFKQIQETACSQLLYSLKEQWLSDISQKIKANFSKEKGGWFDLSNINIANYETGKLKSFLTLVRLEMQASLKELIRTNFSKYVDTISSYVPATTQIISQTEVINTYADGKVLDSRQEPDYRRTHVPLFSIEVKIVEDKIKYSYVPKYFHGSVLRVFEDTLIELGKIHDVESKVLDNKIRRKEFYLNCPRLEPARPEVPDPTIRPKEYISEDFWVWELHDRLDQVMTKAYTPLQDYIKKLEPYEEIIKLNPEEFIAKYDKPENPKPLEFLLEEIKKFREKEEAISKELLSFIQVSCFQVDCRELIASLRNTNKNVAKTLTDIIARRYSNRANDIDNKYKEIRAFIEADPQDIEALTEIEQFIENEMPGKVQHLKGDSSEVMRVYDILGDMYFRVPEADLDTRLNINYKYPSDIDELVDKRLKDLANKKKKLLEEMKSEQTDFKQKIDSMEARVNSYYLKIGTDMHKEIFEEVNRMDHELKELVEKSRKFNSRESLFGRDQSDYSKMGAMIKEFDPYLNMWRIVHNWSKGVMDWNYGEWETVNAFEAQTFVEDGSRILGQVSRFFRDKDPIQFAHQIQIADTYKKKIDEFKPKVPLLVALRMEGMEERHWKEISAKTKKQIDPKVPGFNFEWVVEHGFMQDVVVCQEVGERASREFRIKKQLSEMQVKWEDLSFKTVPYKNTTHSLIQGFDEVETVLDEHLSSTGAMIVNPYNKFYENDIIEWKDKMVMVSYAVDEWRRFQGKWAYLQPIFDGGDISRHLPEEAHKFKQADKYAKGKVDSVKKNPNALKACTEDETVETLKANNVILEDIQNALNQYLETKRSKFARFYFLSDDDLLSILSQTKEVERVQEHLRKVFENINRLEFDFEKQIHAMYSVEGEKVPFLEPLDPVGKQVEDWMSEVESMMKKSVREALLKSIKSYRPETRVKWFFENPGQCSLNGSQVHWTKEVEDAISKKKLKEYIDKLQHQLLEMVKLDRSSFSIMKNITIEALIVIDVHAKEVVELLERSNVTDVGSFEWISQLRYYWESDNCWCRCIQTNFPYGYEYLGNTNRLVITPLTDKCYMTLMGAIKLNLGGAPAGPAGTGKTETTKDLAKALAKQCVVFNCQESMDFRFVAKFFKGLASSGAWCCFDEFNRINIEVLSVIAQQLQDLFKAKAEGVIDLKFEDTMIKILPTFSVFITMNPGYAGRTELPDNLKALFRPMAMMVPDYALIGEIKMYSFGFTQAKVLSKKMVTTFKLSSEQLSNQKHYDYGMRAVTSVINAAGLLMRKGEESDESKLLLRALRDVNVPKFLKDDIPLFENIITDLFPGVDKPTYEYGKLKDAIFEACEFYNLQRIDPFIEKILQLYDTIQVRHGLMLVGGTGGSKTSNYLVLQRAISRMKEENPQRYKKVVVDIINPKSIDLYQLYGVAKDLNWDEGVIEIVAERAVKNQANDEFNWIMFDGPVDAVWIESMNTVLDDNKKLCLSSGKVLILTNLITMMFEVEDLQVASPATVSRCGMVYMEPERMGNLHFVESYITKLPVLVKEKKTFVPQFKRLLDSYLYPMLRFMRRTCRECIQTFDNNLICSFIKLFNVLALTQRKIATPENVDELQNLLEQYVIFAIVWSVCCTVDQDGRKLLDAELRRLMDECKSTFAFGQGATIYDWQFMPEEKKWRLWTEEFKTYQIEPNKHYSEILVPTEDFARSFYLMKTLLTNKLHTLMPGPTGTGKSVNAFYLLQKGLADDFNSLSMSLSAQTKSSQILETIWDQVERRRKGVYGPPQQRKCIVLVDDLNMPQKEEFGAQPPLELIRQYLDHKRWYIFKPQKDYVEIEDIVVLATMGPPGGGRNQITNRLVRHFNIIAYAELQDSVIDHIYSTILTALLSKFDEPVRLAIGKVVGATINIYNDSKARLLPKPGKSHYLFNLRDISKVFQGICRGSYKHIRELEDLCRIWYHENMRVYHDRLTTEEDRGIFKDMLSEQIRLIGTDPAEVINHERIVFADFLFGRESDNPPYYQVDDLNKLVARIEDYLSDYNREVGAKKAMKLVMFLDACEHISRICRVLRLPNGHCLLMGVGGSGRQSLAKLSSYILDLKNFSIEVSKDYGVKEWRESLKTLIMGAVVENKPTCFIFVDTQIIVESMVEDINCLLNSGAIIGLPLNPEEAKSIEDACKNDCVRNGIPANKINMFNAQLNKVKKNTHIVMAMSPLSSQFATRLRMFPALINCCTLDWFTEWPDEALIGVAKRKVEDYVEEFNIHSTVNQIVEMFKVMHKSVEKMSVKYRAEVKRINYVTPTSFLELLSLYISVLKNKYEENKVQFKRFEDGLKKLQSAEEAVADLQAKLIQDKPKLEESEKETKIMLEGLKKEKALEDEAARVIALEEIEAIKQQTEANKVASEAQIKKEESDKKLEEVLAKTKDLKKDHITQLRAYTQPPQGGKIVVQALVYMFCDETQVPGLYKKSTDELFGIGKREVLADTDKLYKSVTGGYNKEDIDSKKVQAVIKNCRPTAQWNYESATKVSSSVGLLYLWVEAMIEFNQMYNDAKPLRDRLSAVMQELEEKTEELRLKKKQQEESQAKLKMLSDKYREQETTKEKLALEINQCTLKLERAFTLVGLLADEKKRWNEEIAKIRLSEKLIPHDSLVSAGMVSYSGPFIAEYRASLEKMWVEKLGELGLPHTPDLKMIKFLGDPVQILDWNLNGLPKDDTSIENGIIIEKSKRWPLMIDPQNQANKYIKSMGEKVQERMDPIKASSPQLMSQLEIRIQNGDWALVENVGLNLDPSLEPILQRLVVMTAGTKTITVNNKQIPYKDTFRFFMTTTLPNPHYSPEISAKVTIINFGITPNGLEDQLLSNVIKLEMPILDETKTKIVKENAESRRTLKDCEDKILKNLSESTGDILMDETLIKELSQSKATSSDIAKKMVESQQTEEDIDKTRELYRPAAFRASILYFCIADLALIDPMYQYALQWYINLFEMGIKNSPQHPETSQRLSNLINYFTYSLYENVCRSLFERHKLLFSFVLTMNILQGAGKLDPLEFRYLLTGPTGEIRLEQNPTDWIAANSWPEIYRQFFGLNQLQTFKGVLADFMKKSGEWRHIYDSNSPQTEALPQPWEQKLDLFQRVMLIRALRLDKMISMIQVYVSENMDKRFVESPLPNLATVFKDSRCDIPIIFVLSAGSDPKSDFDALAKEMNIKNTPSISLGQGQGKKAEKIIEDCMKTTGTGGWVLLQNCHLAATWMGRLEAICEGFGEHNTHPDFRLWLTSMPTPKFPISVLQNSVKMTLEPPTGLKANLKLSYSQLDDKVLKSCKKEPEFKKLLFGLCFFHAIIQERRKFGAIGWNIPYEFTYEDLVVSRRQLGLFLDEYDKIPFKVLNFICAEINYGGRVTDDKDKRLIATILKFYMCPEVLQDGYKFSTSGTYFSPEPGVQADYLNYIETLPLNPAPEVFGLHENAEIITNQNLGLNLLTNVQALQTRSAGVGGKTKEQIVEEVSKLLQTKIPKEFDIKEISQKYPTKIEESMNTVLVQEIEKYNILIKIMTSSLKDILRAISGFITMDEELESLADALYNQRVPTAWGDVFLSLKPLMPWVEDLTARISFFAKWIDRGTPNVFWISGFSFPQAFITGTLQNYARKMKVAIDRISFDFKYMDHVNAEDIKKKPEDGVYITGIFLEGAKWDNEAHCLTDPKPKELYSEMPLIWLIPRIDRADPTTGIYMCPIYKVLSRAGTLSTTGHSTNFVMFIEITSKRSEEEWVKAGVAGFLALRS